MQYNTRDQYDFHNVIFACRVEIIEKKPLRGPRRSLGRPWRSDRRARLITSSSVRVTISVRRFHALYALHRTEFLGRYK